MWFNLGSGKSGSAGPGGSAMNWQEPSLAKGSLSPVDRKAEMQGVADLSNTAKTVLGDALDDLITEAEFVRDLLEQYGMDSEIEAATSDSGAASASYVSADNYREAHGALGVKISEFAKMVETLRMQPITALQDMEAIMAQGSHALESYERLDLATQNNHTSSNLVGSVPVTGDDTFDLFSTMVVGRINQSFEDVDRLCDVLHSFRGKLLGRES